MDLAQKDFGKSHYATHWRCYKQLTSIDIDLGFSARVGILRFSLEKVAVLEEEGCKQALIEAWTITHGSMG